VKSSLLPYLGVIVRARRTDNVVRVGRHDVDRTILARAFALAGGVFLRLVLKLRVSVPQVGLFCDSIHLGRDSTVAVDW
jgi:hypothetical protein